MHSLESYYEIALIYPEKILYRSCLSSDEKVSLIYLICRNLERKCLFWFVINFGKLDDVYLYDQQSTVSSELFSCGLFEIQKKSTVHHLPVSFISAFPQADMNEIDFRQIITKFILINRIIGLNRDSKLNASHENDIFLIHFFFFILFLFTNSHVMRNPKKYISNLHILEKKKKKLY